MTPGRSPRARVLVLSAALALGCGEAAPESAAPSAPPASPAPPVAGDWTPDATLLVAMEERPSEALARLDDRPEAPPLMRVSHALASWGASEPDDAFAVYLSGHGLDAANADVSAALLDLTTRALDASATGVATSAYGAWLAARPEGTPLPTDGRAAAVRLHDALLEVDAGDLAASLAEGVLARDPEHEAIARAHVGALLADDVIAFLTAHRTASWAAALARELPQLATAGDLENAATVDRIAATMTELGGVPDADARTQLTAARDALRATN